MIDNQLPDEDTIAAAFDPNGNLRELQAGQTLTWDRRNQLQQVQPVVRETSDDDIERYRYDASGQRQRKVRITQAKTISHQFISGLDSDQSSRLGLAQLPNARGVTTKAKQAGERVIVLSKKFVKKAQPLDIAKTLIHEASHAVHNTRDFAYIAERSISKSGTTQAINTYVQKLRTGSRTLLTQSPNESRMSTLDQFYYRSMFEASGKGPEDIALRQEIFRTNPFARRDVLLNNADSLATFVVIAHGGRRAAPGQTTNPSQGPSRLRSAWQQLRARFN